VSGCAADVTRFPIRAPLERDPDLEPSEAPCRPDPKKPGETICAPEEYESFVYWDLVDKSVFRPASQLFAVRPGGEAVDVNALDEVPDSSWFENRAGVRELTPQEKAEGFCLGQKRLPDVAAPRSWLVDQGKSDGVTPGFRVEVDGAKLLFKADRLTTPYRASAAEAIGARLYWDIGFHAPCNFVHAIHPEVLRLKPGLFTPTAMGTKVPFDEKALASVLEQAPLRADGTRRMGVSRWLPGRPLGPFTYHGVRDDDPRDVVPHEDRRELRAARLVAAWIGHYDAREQNTMATWIGDGKRGVVKHWYLDFGDSLGTRTKIDDLSRRYGHTYLIDPGDVLFDFFTLGATLRPWERATTASETFPYFTSYGFDPERWKPGYPNPAFSRMTERDAAWLARILANVDDDAVAAAVRAADLPRNETDYLLHVLRGRRDAILRRYLARLSPIGRLAVEDARLCGTDFARRSGVFEESSFGYETRWSIGDAEPKTPLATRASGATVCVDVPRSDVARRVRVRIASRQALAPLDIYLYDEGRGGSLRLLGARRPEP